MSLGKTHKILIDDINNNNSNVLSEVYYMKNGKIYYRSLKDNVEELDETESSYGNYSYYYDETTKSLKMKDLRTEEDEVVYEYKESFSDYVIGENRLYHLGDNSIFVFGKASKQNDLLQKDINELKLVEYDASSFAYADEKQVYLVGENLEEKKEIFKIEDDGKIDSLSKISDSVLQIGVSHLGGANGGFVWSVDKYYRYDFSSGKLEEANEGFSSLKPIDIDADRIEELKEEVKENKNDFNIEAIEQSNSISTKRILDNLNDGIKEEDILKISGLTKEDLKEYVDGFEGNTLKTKKQEFQDVAKRNTKVFENFISLSDTKTIDNLLGLISNQNNPDKYSKFYASVLSGIFNFYIEEGVQKIELMGTGEVPAMGLHEIKLKINDKYLFTCSYGDSFDVTGYIDANSFEEINANYEKYSAEKVYIGLTIMSYSMLESIGSTYTVPEG